MRTLFDFPPDLFTPPATGRLGKAGTIPKIPSCRHARVACARCRRELAKAAPTTSPTAPTLVLLYFDQSDYDPLRRSITREAAHILQESIGGRFENHGKTFRENRRMPAGAPHFPCSKSTDSAASISVREMMANIGEPVANDSSDAPFAPYLRRRAEQKIAAVGRGDYTDDVKAVIISGGRVIAKR